MQRSPIYTSHPGISQSMLKTLEESPRKYEAMYVTRTFCEEPTDAMDFGSLVHGLTLQPSQVADSIALIPESALTSNGQRRGKAWDAFCEDTPGKLRVFREDYNRALMVARKIHLHPFWRAMYPHCLYVENEIYWCDPESGVYCKGIPDIICDHDWSIDVKTTNSLSSFIQRGERYTSKAVLDFGYHKQGAFYLKGASLHYGVPKTRFALLVAETNPPYRVFAMELTRDTLEIGECRMQWLLNDLRRRIDQQDWSEEGEACLLQVGLPTWAS
jgi:exodeoxyribonuclease VIII